jgi:hypothetical protein
MGQKVLETVNLVFQVASPTSPSSGTTSHSVSDLLMLLESCTNDGGVAFLESGAIQPSGHSFHSFEDCRVSGAASSGISQEFHAQQAPETAGHPDRAHQVNNYFA